MRTITAIAALTGTLMIPVWGFFQPVAHAETEIADTLAEIHQSYTPELQGTQA